MDPPISTKACSLQASHAPHSSDGLTKNRGLRWEPRLNYLEISRCKFPATELWKTFWISGASITDSSLQEFVSSSSSLSATVTSSPRVTKVSPDQLFMISQSSSHLSILISGSRSEFRSRISWLCVCIANSFSLVNRGGSLTRQSKLC